jgi:DmsE family decaheme c-type cytochrome
MRRLTTTGRWRWGLYLSGLAILLLAWATVAPAEESAGFADPDSCAACHQEQAEGIAATEHGKQGFLNLSDRGCQSCHGPAAAHVEDPTVVENQPRVSDMPPRDIAERCQQCHSGAGHMFWQSGRHAGAGVTCSDCHSVHVPISDHGQLKTAQIMDTCFGCHQDVRVDSMRASHHPVREGKVACNDCHEPHGTPNDNNIPTASVNEPSPGS